MAKWGSLFDSCWSCDTLLSPGSLLSKQFFLPYTQETHLLTSLLTLLRSAPVSRSFSLRVSASLWWVEMASSNWT